MKKAVAILYSLLVFLVCFESCSNTKKATEIFKKDKTLKEVYRNAFLMGVSVNDAIVSGADKASQDIVLKHFNCITLENSMKAALINPPPGVFNYAAADAFVAFSQAHNMFIIGHTLVGITRCLHGFLLMQKENPIQKKNKLNACAIISKQWPEDMRGK